MAWAGPELKEERGEKIDSSAPFDSEKNRPRSEGTRDADAKKEGKNAYK